MDFTIIGTQLYKQGKDHQLRLCANEKEYFPILAQAHSSIAGGHFSVDTMAKAILMSRIWWPTLFQDANAYVQACKMNVNASKTNQIEQHDITSCDGCKSLCQIEHRLCGTNRPTFL